MATVLSAQCTDERVNQVTPELFRAFPTAAAYATADPEELERIIRPTGFFRNKSRAIIGIGRALRAHHGGEVPASMHDLVKLPGVGRKTANVVLGSWFGQPALPVDTHVTRLVGRLALTAARTADEIERDIHELLPENMWTAFSQSMIWHGRRVCTARAPDCDRCSLQTECPHASHRT